MIDVKFWCPIAIAPAPNSRVRMNACRRGGCERALGMRHPVGVVV